MKLRNCSLKGSTEIASFYGSWLCRSPRHVFDSCGHLSRNREELEYTEARKLMWNCPESGQRTSHGAQRDLAASVQDKLVALKTGLHFPYVLRVISLRSVHCLTDVVLAHRRCSLGATNESKQERLAFRSAPFLQPYVHKVIFSPPSRSEASDELTTRRAGWISRRASALFSDQLMKRRDQTQ